jgi:uridine kinase
MINQSLLSDDENFSQVLYEKMSSINKGITCLELYEFQYALDVIKPVDGWDTIQKISKEDLKSICQQEDFFKSIQLKPTKGNKIVLDDTILNLTHNLMVGLATEEFSVDWVNSLFYFDIRAFCFFIHIRYYNPKILENFGNKPYLTYQPKQLDLRYQQEIGYKDFKEANQDVDQAFITMIYQIIKIHGSPILLTLAGPTGAGKTEITERIRDFLQEKGMQITTVEMDNFYKDREFRDGKTHGKDVIHFDLFMQAMRDLLIGKSTLIPRYDFYLATSSHDLGGNLRSGQSPLVIEPADVILLEGNFPFYIPELDDMIGLRTVYLTDDPIRLKRKWRRDIDLRKKYDPVGFLNRYFKTQFIRAQEIYLPLMEVCDLVADTTAAKLWLKPAWQERLIKEIEI